MNPHVLTRSRRLQIAIAQHSTFAAATATRCEVGCLSSPKTNEGSGCKQSKASTQNIKELLNDNSEQDYSMAISKRSLDGPSVAPDMTAPKTFGPQVLPKGEPNVEWTLEQLAPYVVAQHQTIVDGEKNLTPAYWRLGHALKLAKKNFAHGQWSKQLKEWGIGETRAARVRAIYDTYESEGSV